MNLKRSVYMEPSSCSHFRPHLFPALRGRPQAEARIAGSESFPDITGTVRFYQTNEGVIVCAEISGLPHDGQPCHQRVFGFHIHSGTGCSGNMDDPFADAMSHYDKNGCEHPFHAGDMPPLFGNDGLAVSAFLTGRFLADEVIGRTVIIHDHPDDFTTQPSGKSGTKIACGVIERTAGCC